MAHFACQLEAWSSYSQRTKKWLKKQCFGTKCGRFTTPVRPKLSHWHYFVVILCALLTLYYNHVAALDFTNSNWIWTSSAGASDAPALATAYFRQDFNTPKRGFSANIIIAADDNHTLYVNGELIDQGYNCQESQGYCTKFDFTSTTKWATVTGTWMMFPSLFFITYKLVIRLLLVLWNSRYHFFL